jgi:hypothetical protein
MVRTRCHFVLLIACLLSRQAHASIDESFFVDPGAVGTEADTLIIPFSDLDGQILDGEISVQINLGHQKYIDVGTPNEVQLSFGALIQFSNLVFPLDDVTFPGFPNAQLLADQFGNRAGPPIDANWWVPSFEEPSGAGFILLGPNVNGTRFHGLHFRFDVAPSSDPFQIDGAFLFLRGARPDQLPTMTIGSADVPEPSAFNGVVLVVFIGRALYRRRKH